MRNLLHVVVFDSDAQVVSFINSILLQRRYRTESNSLALHYPSLVRNMYIFDVWANQTIEDGLYIDYGTLHECMRGLDITSLSFEASHLIYDSVQFIPVPLTEDWRCRKLVLTGCNPRWLPFTSSAGGTAYLSLVRQLTLWIPDDDEDQDSTRFSGQTPPPWARNIPFTAFHNLRHLGFAVQSIGDDFSVDFYIITPRDGVACAFEKWSKGDISTVFIEKFTITCHSLHGSGVSMWDSTYALMLAARVWKKHPCVHGDC